MNLQHRTNKLQGIRKETSRETFLEETCTRMSLTFHKNQGHISRYPESDRHSILTTTDVYYDSMGNTSKNDLIEQ